MKFPLIKQHDSRDCGAAAFAMICEYYGKKVQLSKVREDLGMDANGVTILGITEGAKKYNIKADALEGEIEDLEIGINEKEISFPFIARIVNKEGFYHFVVIYGVNKNRFIMGDPAESHIKFLDKNEFYHLWAGQIVTFQIEEDFLCNNEKKGLIWKYVTDITNQKKMLFLILCFMIVMIVTETISVVLMRNIMGARSIPSEITKMGALIIALFLCNGVFRVIEGNIESYYSKNIQKNALTKCYSKILKLPMDYFDIYSTGEIMTRFQDVQNVEFIISQVLFVLLIDVVMTIVYFVLLCFISMKLTVITIMMLAFFIFITMVFRNKNFNQLTKISINNTRINATLKIDLDSIKTIKAYGYEKDKLCILDKLVEDYSDVLASNKRLNNIEDALFSTSSSICIVLIFVAGSLMCHEGSFSTNDLFVFYYLTGMFVEPVNRLINLYPNIQSIKVSADRVDDIYEASEEKVVHSGERDFENGDIVIKNLSYSYGYGRRILKDVNEVFHSGRKMAIIGDSGCGKTTLVKLISCINEIEPNKIFINDHDIVDININSIRSNILYLSSKPDFFNDSIMNNIRCGYNGITDDYIYELCDMLDVGEFVNELPIGYDTILEENANNLSEGQKQKIAIIRAIIRKPRILILDEAMCSIDKNAEKKILDYLIKIDGLTLFVISHDFKNLDLYDDIYVMKDGNIIEKGDYNYLMQKKNDYSIDNINILQTIS
ncbi:MAG: peptidase domain-containing ABC transporter [Eubacterium sp.]|nr:peptidase domain-containing ABC transporter [Eubacterium sp.]